MENEEIILMYNKYKNQIVYDVKEIPRFFIGTCVIPIHPPGLYTLFWFDVIFDSNVDSGNEYRYFMRFPDWDQTVCVYPGTLERQIDRIKEMASKEGSLLYGN